MNEVKIVVKGKVKTFSAPSEWDECTKADLFQISKTVRADLPVLQSEILLALKLFKIPRKLFGLLNSEQRAAIVRLCSFIEQKKILDKNLIPYFWHKLRKYHGPNEAYDNIQGIEFAFAELCYTRFVETKQEQYLDDLVAVLYRNRRCFNITNDIRADFYIRSSNIRSKRFKSLHHDIKFSIFLNYEAWRNWLIDGHPQIFPKADPNDVEAQTEGSSTSLWDKAYRMIAESGVFGNYNEVCKQPILVLFAQLHDKILEAKEAKEKFSKGNAE